MRQSIYQLQILRFVASTMVLVSHVQHEAQEQSFLNLQAFRPFEPIFWAGGVDIFFVISGFVMYYIGHDQFGLPGASGRFMTRRIIRVAPPYWAATMAMLAALVVFSGQVTHSETSLLHILGSVFFIPVPNPYGTFYPVMILGWTLNFEMLFYAIFAVGLLLPLRSGMALVIGALVALGILPFLIELRSAPFAFWANPIVIEFLFGIAIAHLRLSGMRLSAATGWSLFVLGFVLMLVFRWIGFVEANGLLRPVWMGVPALLICLGPALIREPQLGRLDAVRRALVFGGDASFALYLSHPFSINLVALAASRAGLTDPWAYVAVSSVAALVAAALFYLLFERPVTNYLTRRVSGRKPVVLSHVPSAQ